MTIRRYYDSPARRGAATVVGIGTDERGAYLLLDETLFHPQGGGQPSDQGTIEGVEVTHVLAADDGVRHYVASTETFAPDQSVRMKVDHDRRLLHEKLHTAGHLVAAVVELLFPQALAVSGHHWPGEARVDFQLKLDTLDAESMRFVLEPELRRAIARGPKVYAAESAPGTRMIVIDGYLPVPCGGTHVESVSEIEEIALRGLSIKKGTLRVGYDVIAGESDEIG